MVDRQETRVTGSRYLCTMGEPPPELARRYEVVEPLSRGAMGAVYRGRDRQAQRDVAIKQLLDRRHSARFEIEARLLSHLRHPRVVTVLDHFEEPSGQFIVMELVEGPDLNQVLEDSGDPGLPVAQAVEYVRQACEALAYVNDEQIVHRDVKPHNLVVSDEGVVLVDFGVAREVTEGAHGTAAIGTPRFMAPEVLAGAEISSRSDVFGLAATLWALIVGHAPMYGCADGLSRLMPEVTVELEHALCRGLEPRPERRTSSAALFAKAIGGELSAEIGTSLALSVEDASAPTELLEAVVRAAAGVFEAAAASIALTDPSTGELVYRSAWGAGARDIIGVRLAPGTGIGGSVIGRGSGLAVEACREDPRFAARTAARTGYVPNTLLAVPLRRAGAVIGVLSLLDRRDGQGFGDRDLSRAEYFAELAVSALESTGIELGAATGASSERVDGTTIPPSLPR